MGEVRADAPPILRRFPALERVPRASLGAYPTPVDRIRLSDGRVLLVKRDDRCGSSLGGNKVRGLEWLLGSVAPGEQVLTVGPRGSTHALATSTYARLLGARPVVVRWNQEMNEAARCVAARIEREARVLDAGFVPIAYAVAMVLRAWRRPRWIPAGGVSPLALLGHVNAALELADQIDRGECDPPSRVVLPLGTGGTAAGLALGFRIAGVRTSITAVRVVPRVLGRATRVRKLASSAAKFIERLTGERLPRLSAADVTVEHAFYGGAYGRPLRERVDEQPLESAGIRLDDTYSRKAYAAAVAHPGDRTLLWLTFDGRLVTRGD